MQRKFSSYEVVTRGDHGYGTRSNSRWFSFEMASMMKTSDQNPIFEISNFDRLPWRRHVTRSHKHRPRLIDSASGYGLDLSKILSQSTDNSSGCGLVLMMYFKEAVYGGPINTSSKCLCILCGADIGVTKMDLYFFRNVFLMSIRSFLSRRSTMRQSRCCASLFDSMSKTVSS